MCRASCFRTDNEAAVDKNELRREFLARWKQLHRYAFRIIGDRNNAEDACQEAFTNVLKGNTAKPEEYGGLRGLLFAAVRNAAVNQFRKEQSLERRVKGLSQDEASISDRRARAERTPLQQAMDAEEIEKFARKIREMPEELREMVYRRSQGETYVQIGSAMGVSPGTVKNRLRRALG